MFTKKELLNKGIKLMLYALPLMFIGPSVIYNAFINKKNMWHYLVLAVGVFLCFLAVYFLFKGIKNVNDSLFNNER
jgi:uncharacterized membrane protein YfcA